MLMKRAVRLGVPAVLAGIAAPCAGQAPTWVRQFGTGGWDSANAVCADGAAGAYVWGTLDSETAAAEAVLHRYSATGLALWSRQIGPGRTGAGDAIARDGSGGVYVGGATTASVGGANAGGIDALIARYDAAGGQVWIRQVGTGAEDSTTAAAADGGGGVFFAGNTDGSLAGPHAGGGPDAWLARYTGDGTRLWWIQFGTAAWDVIAGAAPDGVGGVFVAGESDGNLGGVFLGNDEFIARYDSAGIRLWVRQFDGGSQNFQAAAPDGAGGVYITKPNWGSISTPTSGYWDVRLFRFDGAGNELWMREFGTDAPDWPYGLGADGAGGVYVAGGTAGSLGGPHAGGGDAFVARIDSAGNQLLVRQFGTGSEEGASDVAASGSGAIYLTGHTFGRLGGPSAGQKDGFVARYDAACYADCTADGQLTVADFGCFQTKFVAADPYADCSGDGSLTVADFGCFQTKFVVGCP